MSAEWNRHEPTQKTGEERLHDAGADLGVDLQAFWRWSVSDLLSNVTRGRLAEFIVARALDISTDGVRDEWAAYDLITPAGVKIEVKSAAFLQSWHQVGPSAITFRTPATRAWDPLTNVQDSEAARQADVYVFAVLAHTDKTTIDPLDVGHWRFYALSTAALNARKRSQQSITLRTLERLCGSGCSFEDLRKAVTQAAVHSGTA